MRATGSIRAMRIVVLIVLLSACGNKKEAAPAPAPASGSAPAKAEADVCRIASKAIEGASCAALLAPAKKSLDGIVQMVGQASADPRKFQVMCAQLLLAIERDAAKQSCKLAIDETQRSQIMKLLDEWYAQRTQVVPTGDAEADKVIAKLAAVRDATCGCRDGACLDQVDKQLTAIGEMPASAPQAARDLGSKLLEDASRCANRVRTITDPPK